MKYPKIIYIQNDRNAEKGEFEPLAWENAKDAEDGKIGVYELKKIVNKRTEVHVED